MIQHLVDDRIRVTIHTYYNYTAVDIREFRADRATIIGVTLTSKEFRRIARLRKEIRRDIRFADTLLQQNEHYRSSSRLDRPRHRETRSHVKPSN